MKMKDLKFYGRKATIWTTFAYTVYRIDCNQLQFTDIRGEDVTVSDIVIYFNGDISVETTNSLKNSKLILKAFSLDIKVADLYGDEVNKIDFLKILNNKG